MTPAGASPEQALIGLADAVYDWLEAGCVGVPAGIADLAQVRLHGEALPPAEVAACVADRIEAAEDVSFFAVRTVRWDREPGRSVYRGTVCLLWSPPGTWDDEEIEVDVTVALAEGAAGWSLESFAIDTATPEPSAAAAP